MINRRFKVLISAYSCGPGRGSESGVGWSWVKQISRFNDVWVITRVRSQKLIEETLKKTYMPNVNLVYYDLPSWARYLLRGEWGVHLEYYIWQIRICFVCKKLHARIKFDLAHHVTFARYWMPSFLAFLPVAFVFGPVGGADSTPHGFFRTFSLRGKIYEFCFIIARWLFERFLFNRFIIGRSEMVFATTFVTRNRLIMLGCKEVRLLSAIGMENEELNLLDSPLLPKDRPFRFVSIGRLWHIKGFNLSLAAFERVIKKLPGCEYWFIGDGPERINLMNMVRSYGLGDKVIFFGNIPRTTVLKNLAECHVLIHPSLHENGGYACLEAMAAKKPVVCLDLAGPAISVTNETGIKIKAVTYKQVIKDLVDAMLKLANDPGLCKQMGEAGHKRVLEHFMWDKKGEDMYEVYKEIINTLTAATTMSSEYRDVAPNETDPYFHISTI